jgi:16S rRNA (cytosine1402-N4)-methyltransferase
MTAAGHRPVLRAEAVAYLQPAPGKRIVDGTYGRGGHASALLEAGADVLALDLDAEAVAACRAAAAGQPRLRCRQGSFGELAGALAEAGWRAADGVLLDLGVSSPQLDDAARGFSYRADAELDLRFDRGRGEPAHRLLARLGEDEIAGLLRDYGEERAARRIARAVVEARRAGPLTTTGQLRAAVERVVPPGPHRTASLSRVFQALRIAVNRELDVLAEALAQLPPVLAPAGVVVVIAYHSLEDRLVKRWIERESRDCICPPGLPECRCGHHRSLRSLTGKPVRPGAAEQRENPRARSARLRAAQRLA